MYASFVGVLSFSIALYIDTIPQSTETGKINLSHSGNYTTSIAVVSRCQSGISFCSLEKKILQNQRTSLINQ